jgi:hypothetical protein
MELLRRWRPELAAPAVAVDSVADVAAHRELAQAEAQDRVDPALHRVDRELAQAEARDLADQVDRGLHRVDRELARAGARDLVEEVPRCWLRRTKSVREAKRM